MGMVISTTALNYSLRKYTLNVHLPNIHYRKGVQLLHLTVYVDIKHE